MDRVFTYPAKRTLPGERLPRSQRSSAGFTLLEIIIVMMLASIILGLATIFFANTLPSQRLNATGRDLSAFIRQARYLAQNRGEDLVLIIDLDQRLYGIEGFRVKKIPSDISIKALDPLEGDVIRGKYPILFRATGGVEGGSLVLWHKKKVVYIEMDPVVGSVKVRQ
jgi:general secretion pathway protein H